MISVFAESHDALLGFYVSGRFTAEDYRALMPLIESTIAAHGRARILFCFEHFDGWDLAAIWDDLLFATRLTQWIDRFALVGDGRHQLWSAQLGQLFGATAVRNFSADELAAAWAWLEEGRTAASARRATQRELTSVPRFAIAA